MTEPRYSYTHHGPAPLVYMGPGVVEVVRAREYDSAPGTAELRPGDVLVLDHPLTVDALAHFAPADRTTKDAMELLEAVEPEPPATEDEDPDAYPHGGTVSEVEGWVGDDPDRAREAMHNEVATGSPRKTLTDALERLVLNQES